MNAVCLVFDRLHLGYLGAYGNTWIRTPGFDRLAAEGFVCDCVFAESPALGPLYEGYWSGHHAMQLSAPDPAGSLPALLASRSVHTALLSDDLEVTGHPWAAAFEQIVQWDFSVPTRAAATFEDTWLARCFAHAIDWLASARTPFLLWCHFAGLGRVWDAPRDWCLAYHEEGDPHPPDTLRVPHRLLPAHYDPDELIALSHLYAAQVAVADACIEVLRQWLQSSPAARETLLIVTAARGFPMGEHGRIGVCDEPLYSELVQVPLLVRLPDAAGAADRSSTLVQPSDLCPTLAEWFAVPMPPQPPSKSLLGLVRGEMEVLRDRVGLRGGQGQRAMITPAWYLRAAERAELFLRPDDRWQANEVADRCPDVTQAMLTLLDQYEHILQTAPFAGFAPLDPLVASPPE